MRSWFEVEGRPKGLEKLKIVRVIARLNVGGPAQHVTWLGAGLHERGHRECLVTGSVAAGELDMTEFGLSQTLRLRRIPAMSREISWRDLGVAWRILRILLEHEPDVIHTHTAKAGAVGRIAAFAYRAIRRVRGKPVPIVVHTFHGHVFHGYYGRFRSWAFVSIERALAMATDCIVVLSQSQLEEIHGRFKIGRRSQFEIVPLGLDLERFRDSSARRQQERGALGIDEACIAVAIVGRVTSVKNHELFLNVAALLERRRPGRFRFLIVGEGDQLERTRDIARRQGLQAITQFLGNRSDVEAIYAAVDVVVLTSINEGTPLALIEAMASSRPFVATAVGGVGDIAGPPFSGGPSDSSIAMRAHGILVKGFDPTALATAVEYLGDHPSERIALGTRGRSYVYAKHTVARLVNDVERLYVSRLRYGRGIKRAPIAI